MYFQVTDSYNSLASQLHEIHPGDTVSIAPNERHWHGASAGNTMVHLAIQETDAQGVDVVWLEPVTDQEYNAR